MPKKNPSLVIALGGNAISKPGMRGTISEQYFATHESMEHVVKLVKRGYGRILLTHGNGPQVGNVILRSELASKYVYPLPMDTCVADTQGGMGYMIQQVLTNLLRQDRLKNDVVTVISQVLVDVRDPAFDNPTKPIGKFYTKHEAKELMAAREWTMKEDAGRGWRRVVPSPKPIDVIEKETIKTLFKKGMIVVAGGGGGIPVGKNRQGKIYGIEAVIDKDLTSALIAKEIKADVLIILTAVEYAYTGYGTPKKKAIKKVSIKELKKYLAGGEFADGSMRPKIEACIKFLEGGGKQAIITRINKCLDALAGRTGTHIYK